MSKNMLENIRAVIFDLDGTLVDSMWMWESIDIEFLTARGLEMPENLKYELCADCRLFYQAVQLKGYSTGTDEDLERHGL